MSEATDTAGDDPLAMVAAFRLLSPAARALLTRTLEPAEYAFGDTVVRQGDSGDSFYLITEGSARALKITPSGDEVPLRVLSRGECFGEAALLRGEPRSATVRARGPLRCLVMHRSVFLSLVDQEPGIRPAFEALLRTRDLWDLFRVHGEFAAMSTEGVARMAAALEPVNATPGQVITRQGDAAGPLFVVAEGRLRVSVEDVGEVAFLREGDFFGEASLLEGQPRNATVTAVSDCRLWALQPDDYGSLLEHEPAFAQRVSERRAMYRERRRAAVPLDFAEEVITAEVAQVRGAAEAGPRLGMDDAELGEGSTVRPSRRAGRVRITYQLDEMDCGPACLAMLCQAYGHPIPITTIRELAGTSTEGTTLAAIRRSAEALGYESQALRVSPSKLGELPLPAVVHWEGNHWVLLTEVTGSSVRLADPARGLRRVPLAEFREKWTGFAATFAWTPAVEDVPSGATDLGWLRKLIRPYRRLIAFAVFLAAIAAALELVLPVATQYVVDEVAQRGQISALWRVVPALLLAIAALIAASGVERYLLSLVAVRFDTQSLDFLTTRLLSLPPRYFSTRRTGDIERRLSGGQVLRQFIVDSSIQVLTAGMTFLACTILMLTYSPILTLVFLATTSLYLLLMRYSSRRLRPMYEVVEESYGRYASSQIDAIRGIDTVKAMAAEEQLASLMLSRFQTLAQRIFRGQLLVLGYDSGLQIISFVSFASLLIIGAVLVALDHISIGQFVAFQALYTLASAPLLVVIGLWDRFQMMRVVLRRLDDVVGQEPEQADRAGGLTQVRSLGGSIRLRNVGFRYASSSAAPVLHDVSLDISPGETVALVGRSGSGKSTLVKLLAGLMEPTEGLIEFDGHDMRNLDYRSLRRHIGIVLQETHLFNDSIAANIAFGEATPDRERMRWAARAAAVLDVVESLPLGFETKIGESGMKLSGGQAQRIAIARALYRKPSVLLFDEATSALDTESERAVKESLDELLAGRTSVVIAHRLSTIRNADRIIVLERGRVAEQGTHEELVALRGLYFHLVTSQLES